MISILMATFNGEQYVKAQIDSLLAQTFCDFTLWVSDDASTDSTWSILESYAQQYPQKMNISKREINSGNSRHNFLDLMVSIKDDYIMLCDQDDVWLPDKIEKTLAKMKAMEGQYPDMPVLVRTDAKIVDQDLHVIYPSYKQVMHSNFDRTDFCQVLIQNTFMGCTAMYNRALAKLIGQKPDYCVMHDWWLELIAAAFGKLGYVDEPTMLYRQHGINVVGVKDVRKLSYKIHCLIHNNDIKKAIRNTYDQARNFLQIYEDRMTEVQKDIARRYCEIPAKGKVARWRAICALGAYKNGLSRNIAYFLFV